jgi:hypothetical protein
MGLSLRAFARTRGVTHQTVRKAIARGRLVPLPDGTIDAAAAEHTWPRGAPSARHDVPPAGPGASTPDAFDPRALDRARWVKTTIEAQRARLELEHRRGALIDRDRATRKAFAYTRVIRDAWLAWPARVGPLLAAQFEADAAALTVALEDHVRTHLTELADERVEF